ncbi:hypothetical protein [Xanthomonas phage XAJ2]|uniref:Uncharacterized protein n=1 Tax=Xanthomonas phage XAJ2 TaxID=1775249 RepID=A0A1I9L2G0_9CAUD|nr:hypothetical protein [Xanthomonas phage XAJ2]
MPRDKAYDWLGRQLEIEREACHFSLMSDDDLLKVPQITAAYIEQNGKALLRRRKKRDAKAIERDEREFKLSSWKRAKR